MTDDNAELMLQQEIKTIHDGGQPTFGGFSELENLAGIVGLGVGAIMVFMVVGIVVGVVEMIFG